MRTVKVTRYICGFCRKSGCHKKAMEEHETTCVKNPDRVCSVCEENGLSQAPLPELVSAYRDGGIDGLRERADGCPYCMLAAVIQAATQALTEDPDACPFDAELDFSAEKKRFWDDVNEAEWHRQMSEL